MHRDDAPRVLPETAPPTPEAVEEWMAGRDLSLLDIRFFPEGSSSLLIRTLKDEDGRRKPYDHKEKAFRAALQTGSEVVIFFKKDRSSSITSPGHALDLTQLLGESARVEDYVLFMPEDSTKKLDSSSLTDQAAWKLSRELPFTEVVFYKDTP